MHTSISEEACGRLPSFPFERLQGAFLCTCSWKGLILTLREICGLWGRKESDTPERRSTHTHIWTRTRSFSSFTSHYLSTGGELQHFSRGPIHLLPQEDTNVTRQSTLIALPPPQVSFNFFIVKGGSYRYLMVSLICGIIEFLE